MSGQVLSQNAAVGAAVPQVIRKQKTDWRGWLFTWPFAVTFLLVFITPLVYAAYLSFFRSSPSAWCSAL